MELVSCAVLYIRVYFYNFLAQYIIHNEVGILRIPYMDAFQNSCIKILDVITLTLNNEIYDNSEFSLQGQYFNDIMIVILECFAIRRAFTQL